MSSKQSRRFRAAAYAEAQRLGLWKKGETQVFGGFQGFFRRLFARRRWTGIVGRWYKSNLKRFAKLAANYVHSGQDQKDFLERRRFDKVRRRLAIKRNREALERRKASNG